MAHHIDEEIADLRQMTVEQLRARHGEVCGCKQRSENVARAVPE